MYQVIQYLGWDINILLSSMDNYSQEITDRLKLLYDPAGSATMIIDSQAIINNQVGRMIKPLGTRFTILLANGGLTKRALIAAEDVHIAGEGYGFILAGPAGHFVIGSEDNERPVFTDGLLMMAEPGTLGASSEEHYKELVITKLLTEIGEQFITDGLDLYDTGTPTSRNLKTYVESHYTQGYKNPAFELYNMQNGSYQKVGEVTPTTYTKTSTIIFPGDTTVKPESLPATIPMS